MADDAVVHGTQGTIRRARAYRKMGVRLQDLREFVAAAAHIPGNTDVYVELRGKAAWVGPDVYDVTVVLCQVEDRDAATLYPREAAEGAGSGPGDG